MSIHTADGHLLTQSTDSNANLFWNHSQTHPEIIEPDIWASVTQSSQHIRLIPIMHKTRSAGGGGLTSFDQASLGHPLGDRGILGPKGWSLLLLPPGSFPKINCLAVNWLEKITLTSLRLSFLFCKMRTLIVPPSPRFL